jgi:very-short-patch-repair endonuclease
MPREKEEQWVIPQPLRQKMTEVARTLRHTPTATENLLWQNLRGKQRGYKVRCQQPIGVFIVDFYIPQAKLIVEIDGLIHTKQQENDRQRQALLEQLGLQFLRFSTSQVEHNLSHVLHTIDNTVLAAYASCSPLP